LGPGRFWNTVDQHVARPLPTHGTTQTQNKRAQTSMPRVGFEPTIPAFERTKIVHALDREATVIGISLSLDHNIFKICARFGVYIRGEVRKHLQCSQNQGNGTALLTNAFLFQHDPPAFQRTKI
jgi:hypothetical protein